MRNDESYRHIKKYNDRNIIHRLTISRFFDAIALNIKRINPIKVLDFGCGEGLFLQQMIRRNVDLPNVLGIDIREDALQYAKFLHPGYEFINVDVLSWDCVGKVFDLIIASQVLEHLTNPDQVLEKLVFLGNKFILLTVPWEPWFRLINLIRGRDILRLGNHPEHINQWSHKEFKHFVSKYATIINSFIIFPYTIINAKIN